MTPMAKLCVQGYTPCVDRLHSHLFMAYDLELDMDFMALDNGTSLMNVYSNENKTFRGVYLHNEFICVLKYVYVFKMY